MDELTRAKNNAYSERNQLVAFLSRLYESHIFRHPEEDKDYEEEWRWIVCVHSPAGQLTWHIHEADLGTFSHLEPHPYSIPGHWDGHTTGEKYERLRRLPRHG